jgi:hypothetical protein
MSTQAKNKSPGAEADTLPEIRRRASASGLCASCVHRLAARSQRSVFVRCGLAVPDGRFPRYPILPVNSCSGFVRSVS